VPQPFDAVLVIAFGGPQGPADVRPFLANVLRGRRVSPGRVEEVAHHYELFGGVSPLNELTDCQARGLADRLRTRGTPLPVYVGMRNWTPYLRDTLARMSRDGVRRAIGFIAAAHRSYSSCLQYKENVADARAALRETGLPDVEVTYVGDWYAHPDFIAANAEHLDEALDRLPPAVRAEARIVFTAHSIPESMARQYPYAQQYEETARLIAGIQPGSDPRRVPGSDSRTVRADGRTYATVYQSRSGRPEDPWLGPDVCEYLRAEHARGLRGVVLSPIGFLCDHIEVLYDLDVEAADLCRSLNLPMVRARAVNDSPRFLDMMADVVMQAWGRYDGQRPLPIVSVP
jgi:ferrochelatase